MAAAGVLPGARAANRPLRILHVPSYQMAWQWNQDQLRGFREGLALPGSELRIVELDAKHAAPAALKDAARRALDLVDDWKPDLLYTNDDVAQAEVGVRLIGRGLPQVFSGVNRDLETYGYERATEVTGVLEREHFLGSVGLLRDLVPGVRRLAMVFDDDPTWIGVAARIRQDLARRRDIEVLHWLQPRTVEEYQSRIADLQGEVDAVGLIGIFRFAKAGGGVADYESVLRWTAEHSRLPDFSFWDTRVERGTLCAMTVDGVEQGRQAGRIARRILVEGVAPAAIPAEPTTRGRPMISLARARRLGLKPQAEVLLNATVLPRFAWER